MRLLVVSADRTLERGVPLNLGDAYLTDALLDWLQAQGHDVDAVDFGAGRVRRSRIRRRDLRRVSRGYEAVLIGGGTVLANDSPQRRFGGLPRLVFAAAISARLARRPAIIACAGADPIHELVARTAVRATLQMVSSTILRDTDSVRRIEELTGRRPVLGCDAALLPWHPPSGRRSLASQLEGNIGGTAVLALNRAQAAELTDKHLASLSSMFQRVLLLSMDQSEEWDFRQIGVTPSNTQVVEPNLQWASAREIIATADLLIGSRMHALYMAAQVGTPIIAVRSSPKVQAFAAMVGTETCSMRSVLNGAASHRVEPRLLMAERDRGRDALLAALGRL